MDWMICLPKGTTMQVSMCPQIWSPTDIAVPGVAPQTCTPTLNINPIHRADVSHDSQGGVYFWSYVYYLSKFYEFFDTILNVLKVRKVRMSQGAALASLDPGMSILSTLWYLPWSAQLTPVHFMENVVFH